MGFNAFIKELKKTTGLEGLRSEADGSYALKINHMHLVRFAQSADHKNLYLYASLCSIPASEHEKVILFDRLLAANHFGKDTGDAWCALDENSHQMVLIDRMDLHRLDVHTFVLKLQSFISSIQHLKEITSDLSAKHQPVASARKLHTHLRL